MAATAFASMSMPAIKVGLADQSDQTLAKMGINLASLGPSHIFDEMWLGSSAA
jgi:hypothetical protein